MCFHLTTPQTVLLKSCLGQLPKPKLYSMTPRELEELMAFTDKNLTRGFIQPAKLWMAVHMVFREKKDGSLRLCVDYWGLNAIYIENVYPLPLMKDMLSFFAKGKYFIKLDLREAYYQVWIKEDDGVLSFGSMILSHNLSPITFSSQPPWSPFPAQLLPPAICLIGWCLLVLWN